MQNERNFDLERMTGATRTGDSPDTLPKMDDPAAGTRLGAEEEVSGATPTEGVRDMASNVRHQAAEKVEERISNQKHRATESLEEVAQSLRAAGSQLSEQEGVGRYMVQAANQVDNLASFLRNHEVAEILDDVEGFARRQPTVFFGGAFALGVLGARFLKSSRRSYSSDMHDNRSDRGTPGGSVGGYQPERDQMSTPSGYGSPSRSGESGYAAPGQI